MAVAAARPRHVDNVGFDTADALANAGAARCSMDEHWRRAPLGVFGSIVGSADYSANASGRRRDVGRSTFGDGRAALRTPTW